MQRYILIPVMFFLLACSFLANSAPSMVDATVTSTPSHTFLPKPPEASATLTPVPTSGPTNTLTPTTTSTATYEPTYTTGPTSTATRGIQGFKIQSFSQAVKVGSTAKLRILTAPGATCKLTYSPPKYFESNLGEGLQKADANGICYWTWTVGYKAGMGKIRIFANGYGETHEIYIYEDQSN